MRRRLLSITLLLVLLGVFLPARVTAEPDAWTSIVPGIDYNRYHLSDPVNIYVARMDRHNPNVTIESSIASGYLNDGVRESVPAMSRRYDQAIGFWNKEWGTRNKVAVAINGFFFGPPSKPKAPRGADRYSPAGSAKRFTENQSVTGFAWTSSREAFIGECNYYQADDQRIYYLDAQDVPLNSSGQKFQGVNVARENDQIIIYTPQYGQTTGTDDTGTEVLVEMDRPAAILPNPAMAKGTIREVRPHGSSTIPFNYIVLSAKGTPEDVLLFYAATGARIGISQAISWCNSTPAHGRDWTNTYASIGGDKYFLKGGAVQSYPNGGDPVVRNARTAIAYSADYVYFIVVDGKHPGVSLGMTLPALAQWAKSNLGATDAVSEDSGGSATMAVNGQIVNDTYCNFTDCRSAQQQIPDEPGHSYTPEEIEACTPGNCEPAVANGMLMVEVQAPVTSTLFLPGGTYTPGSAINLRLGPGTNYPSIATINAGTPGDVQDSALNGIYAKGLYWWNVEFGGQVGWAPVDSRLVQTIRRYLPLIR